MRSRWTRWPPASTIATVTAMSASCARAIAVAMIFFAPAAVSRFAAPTYMSYILGHAALAYRALPRRRRRHRRDARLVRAGARHAQWPASRFRLSGALDVPRRRRRGAHRPERQDGRRRPEEISRPDLTGRGAGHGRDRSHRVSRDGAAGHDGAPQAAARRLPP